MEKTSLPHPQAPEPEQSFEDFVVEVKRHREEQKRKAREARTVARIKKAAEVIAKNSHYGQASYIPVSKEIYEKYKNIFG